MTKQTKSKWLSERKNLEKTIKKYPKLIISCLDAAYLAGMEVVKKVKK